MSEKSPISMRLKEARLAAGLSQKQLGILAGIDEFVASARMNQYETGKHTPDFSILSEIARVLELPVAYFYVEDDVLAQIISLYGKLNINNKRNALKLIRQL
ncbi:MAG TPA: helix-turn-helix transcriptional regulator [Gammaproteobacteria bacterium]|nr:helix-turn-helix transcriptional regulator [Gammaproteobacteria bacterium]